MRLKLISCEVFQREVRNALAHCRNHVDAQFLEKPPHQLSDAGLVELLQALIDQADRDHYHAVLMVLGSCKQGLTGLLARSVPLVLPRAKDCISLLLERTPPAHTVHSRETDRVLAAGREDRVQNRPAQPEANSSAVRGCLPPRLSARGSFWLARPRTVRSRMGLKSSAPGMKACQMNGRLSLLASLVQGYWSYGEFVVVPPGWRVVVKHDQGTITAEEML